MGSGAQVLVIGDVAVKVNGGHRLNEQAEWLTELPSPGLVRVLGDWEGGYAMERLERPIFPVKAEDVIKLLKDHVWRHPARVAPDWKKIETYGTERARLFWPEVEDQLCKGILDLADKSLTRVRVHGDPTFENVMLRKSQLVLIDPLPARPEAPDLLAIDLGKILQSSCGYESALVGERVPEPNVRWLREFQVDERVAARTFALYHMVRLLPYLPGDEVRNQIKETVGANVLGL